MHDSLQRYRQKRDFSRTPEPRGGQGDQGAPRFVIQKHDASSLHYDLRLEADGALLSWAVPKGLSTDPRQRRLALPTEDHPLDYIHFEGVIPEGEYGAGTVLVWDTGDYENIKTDDDGNKVPLTRCREEGHITVWLHGEKLAGGYALIRTDSGGRERWLVVKMDDDEADARRNPVSTEPDSVLTGRSLDDVRRDDDTAEDTR